MTEQWKELKETITEMRDNGGTGTQEEVCTFLVNLMNVLERQMQPPMRDATEEERKSVKDYIESISKPTGLQFDDAYEELDITVPHKKIPCTITIGTPCENCISREAVIEWLKDQDIIKMNWQEENARKELAKLQCRNERR